jgi:predicted ATPase
VAAQGLAEQGMQELQRGIAACRSIGAELGMTHLLALLAEAYGKGERPAEGLDVLTDALVMVEKNEERHREAELYRIRGELLLRLTPPDVGGAEASLQRALDIARRQSAKSFELRAAISLSRLWAQQGKRAAARQLLAPIYGGFTEGFDTLDLRETQGLLESLG